MKKIFALSAMALAIMFASCDDDNNDTPNPNVAAPLSSQVLKSTMENVVLPTYKELQGTATKLYNACVAFEKDASEANLKTIKDAWRAARVDWEQSESFLYGPTDEQGLDPALDEWPVDVEGMNAIINDNKPITPEVISASNETRGFHLIEYLVWGVDSNKKASDITAREKEYLKAAALDVKQNAEALVTNWTPYINHFIYAGQDNARYKKYPSTRSALEEMVKGMEDICNEVGSEKIENPLNGEGDAKDGKPHFDLEESRFSHNSKTDYVNNIESISNVYLNSFRSSKKENLSISHLIKNVVKDEKLDTDMRKAILDAQKAIRDIPGTFTDAIKENNPTGRVAVKAAQTKVGELHDLIEKRLLPAIQNSEGL